MSPKTVIRAWKDEEYRLSLSEVERAQLPAHPAGLIELTDTEMYAVAGGTDNQYHTLCSSSHPDCPPPPPPKCKQVCTDVCISFTFIFAEQCKEVCEDP